MDFDCDYRAEATAAMEMAAAATNEAERLKWLRIALAWRDLELPPGSPDQAKSYDNQKRSHRSGATDPRFR